MKQPTASKKVAGSSSRASKKKIPETASSSKQKMAETSDSILMITLAAGVSEPNSSTLYKMMQDRKLMEYDRKTPEG